MPSLKLRVKKKYFLGEKGAFSEAKCQEKIILFG